MKKTKIILFIIILVILGEVFIYKKISQKVNCANLPDSYKKIECLMPLFEDLAQEQSTQIALETAQQYQDNKKIDQCHLIAHSIGKATLIKNNYELAHTFSECTADCINGCYHGVMEEYISKEVSLGNLTSEVLQKDVPKMCDFLKADNEFSYRQCLHGSGHGFLAHGYLSLNDAIQACSFFETPYENDTCLGGVFMENMDYYLPLSEKILVSKINSICKDVESLSPDLYIKCANSVGEGLMFFTGHDLVKSQSVCELLNDSNSQEICIEAAKHELLTNDEDRIRRQSLH